MAWQIGIDEAGYGPNLGPLVIALVAFRLPNEEAETCLWHRLRSGVRRHDEPADSRPLVADSKLVYSPTRGLRALEHGVLGALFARAGGPQRPDRPGQHRHRRRPRTRPLHA